MKKKIGKTIHTLRVNKGMTLKELSENNMSASQLSNIENGLKMPSADKFIILLNKLNVKYDEFILLMDDEYLKEKAMIERRLAESVKLKNTNMLKKLSKDSSVYYNKYNDIYFQHVELIAHAMFHVIESSNDFNSAREYLSPIKEYLSNIDEWNYYELSLISNCLFMFEIETAILLGESALKFIEKNYTFYRNEEITCALLNNLATYSLENDKYYQLALKYSQISANLSSTINISTRSIRAKIIYQLACLKVENGQYNKGYLISLIEIFKLLEWYEEYDSIQKFVRKHGAL